MSALFLFLRDGGKLSAIALPTFLRVSIAVSTVVKHFRVDRTAYLVLLAETVCFATLTMMSCRHVSELITAYFSGSLLAEEYAIFVALTGKR